MKRVQMDTTNLLSPKILGENAHGEFYPDPTALNVLLEQHIIYVIVYVE
ncbi:hypothetical protein BA1DRAFT_03601 [Photorhabdus aegyptia]|uniref:Uncharacterized protein n=1 Tax=Photorhabdus aegyptia TaxID=2805098 RepID=A0A022PDZ5_9GAMM|nr:hypothetical protein BA1DRAFT_03601 [Photorhabdus aegyptia]